MLATELHGMAARKALFALIGFQQSRKPPRCIVEAAVGHEDDGVAWGGADVEFGE